MLGPLLERRPHHGANKKGTKLPPKGKLRAFIFQKGGSRVRFLWECPLTDHQSPAFYFPLPSLSLPPASTTTLCTAGLFVEENAAGACVDRTGASGACIVVHYIPASRCRELFMGCNISHTVSFVFGQCTCWMLTSWLLASLCREPFHSILLIFCVKMKMNQLNLCDRYNMKCASYNILLKMHTVFKTIGSNKNVKESNRRA